MKKILFVCFLCITLSCGCSSGGNDNLISYMDAKEKIINNGAILVDVRTEEEYNDNHIGGAINIDYYNMENINISDILTNYDDEIIVYCRSGKRSSEAKKILENLGYSKVYDLGSINNWEE